MKKTEQASGAALDLAGDQSFNLAVKSFLSVLRGTFRLILFTGVILVYLLWSYLCHLVLRNPNRRLNVFSRNTQFFAKILIFGLRLKLEIKNQKEIPSGYLLVSNHMGFLDILCLATSQPLVFVTSTEMRSTPFLGLLTELGGCIYVERRSRTKILSELQTITNVLQDGHTVVLYPEAKASNGEQVLPFKKTLLMAAAQAGVPLQPVVINYREINGKPFTKETRDSVCWYDDVPFVKSMWLTMSAASIHAEIEFLDTLHPKPADDRSLVANQAYAMIAEKFVPAT